MASEQESIPIHYILSGICFKCHTYTYLYSAVLEFS